MAYKQSSTFLPTAKGLFTNANASRGGKGQALEGQFDEMPKIKRHFCITDGGGGVRYGPN